MQIGKSLSRTDDLIRKIRVDKFESLQWTGLLVADREFEVTS